MEEVAYEHWHRMLFARFLAENNLLMFDGVAVTLEECDDLAADEGAANGWELAARCAAKMLPQIFCPDSPVFQLHFAANHQLPLEKLISIYQRRFLLPLIPWDGCISSGNRRKRMKSMHQKLRSVPVNFQRLPSFSPSHTWLHSCWTMPWGPGGFQNWQVSRMEMSFVRVHVRY